MGKAAEDHRDVIIPIEGIVAQLILLCRGLLFDILVLSLDAIGDSLRIGSRNLPL